MSRTIRSAAFLFLGVLLFIVVQDSSASLPRKRILVLFPYESNMPGFISFDSGFRSILSGSKDYEFELFIECMDLTRFPDERYHQKLKELYRQKYSALKIDLIVANLYKSLNFLAEYSPESFLNIPVIYYEQDLRLAGSSIALPTAASIAGRLDLEGTLAMAMRLHPDVRNVYVVTGASKLDESLRSMTREAFSCYESRLDIQYLSGLPMNELIHRASSLPAQSLLFYLSVFLDGAGQAFKSPDALALISKQANAPIYSISETYIDSGIVGGNLVSHSAQGARLARVALSILDGEKPIDTDPNENSGNRFIFDARQLKRWGISENDLPPGSEVRYREFSIWEAYRWQIVGVTLTLAIQALLISALFITIGRQRRTDRALREAESKYRTVADFTYDWECWVAPDGHLLYVSPACKRITGYSSQSFMEKPSLFYEIVDPEDRNTWEEHVQLNRAEPQDREVQLRVRTRDGNIRWIEHTCRPVTNEKGEFQGIRASNRDITDRKQMQDRIQRAADEWQSTFDSISDLIMLVDEEFRIVRVNAAVVSFLGLTLDRILGEHCYTLMHGTSAPASSCPVSKMFQTKGHEEAILFDERRDAWFLVSVDPILDDKNEIRGVVHTIKNVTDHKRAQEALKASEEFNRAVLSSMRSHIAILDNNGMIRAVNEAWEQFSHGNGAQSLSGLGVGANYLEVCRRSVQAPGDLAGQALNGILAVLNGKRDAFLLEYPCDSPSESRWFVMKVMPFRNPEGGVVISHTDITIRKNAELEAQMRREELTHVTRIVTIGELATSLAHEINQPMTAILCNAEAAQRFLASSDPDLEEVRKILDDIVQDDRRAGEVIRRIRTLVKKEAPVRETVVLNDVIRETIVLVQSASSLGRTYINAELHPELPTVQGDRVQLQQVLLNLLLNANAAMTDTPPALRRLIVKTAMQDTQTVLVSISDSGTGIDSNAMDCLFKPFYTTKKDGMGMGLSISRTIINVHGGTIWAENNREGGAAFCFTLPLDGEGGCE